MLTKTIDNNLYKITFLVSLLLSILAVSIDPVVNNDGVWYLSVAKLFAAGEFVDAVRLDIAYAWPFFPFLIGSISAITGMDVESSAWVLNALFAAATTVGFVAIVRELGADRQTSLFAALIILTIPLINDYRSFVIRDHGYWACYSWGLFYFLRCIRTQTIKHALAWATFVILGALFRTESVFFLVFAPLVIFFFADMTLKQRIYAYIRTNAVLIVMAILGLLTILVVNQVYQDKQLFGLFARHVSRGIELFSTAGDVLVARAKPLTAGVLEHYSTGFAVGAVILLLIYIFTVVLLKAITIPYVVLWAYAKKQGVSVFSNRQRQIVTTYILINIFFLSIFLFENAFLVTRYILALVMTLLLVMPFYLTWFYARWKQGNLKSRGGRIITYTIAVIAVVLALDAFISTGSRNTYYKEAGVWLGDTLRPNERLYSSILQVRFYADTVNLLDYKSNPHIAINELRNKAWDEVVGLLDSGKYQNYDYVVLKIKRRREQNLQYAVNVMGKEPEKIFENNKGDRVVVFKITNSDMKKL